MPKPGIEVAKEALGDTLAIRLMSIKNRTLYEESVGREPSYGPGHMQGIWDAAQALGLEDAVRRALTIREGMSE